MNCVLLKCNEIIAPVNVDLQKNMTDIVRQDVVHCNDDEFLTLKALNSITFTGTRKSNLPEVIELKKNILVAMEYMDDYSPVSVGYSFGTAKKLRFVLLMEHQDISELIFAVM